MVRILHAEPNAVWVHASELITGRGFRARDGRRVKEDDLNRIPDGAIVQEKGKIQWVGKTRDLPKKYLRKKIRNLKQKRTVLPGFVDAHTHLVFAGDRSREFAERCAGKSYQEIQREGGGIQTTVKSTRAVSEKVLLQSAIARVRESMRLGVNTLEVKSGYGLSTEAELKILRVHRELKKRAISKFPQLRIQSTFLGAHDFPRDQSRESYLNELTEMMIPQVARSGLADACDVFIDEGYYTAEEGKRILEAAKKAGLKVKMHGDELTNTESAVLGAKLGALSVDHLLCVSDRGIEALAQSETTAVLLPTTAFYLKASNAPARKLLEAGARVALATDFNPGTSMTLNLPFAMTLAALYLKMSAAEILCAVTYSGARALDYHRDRGTLEVGMDGTAIAAPFERFEEIFYRFGY